MNDRDEVPAFARSVGGKRSARIEARVTDELKMDLARKCHELGMTESEFIDRLVAISLYGLDHVLSIERRRTELVCGLSATSPRSGVHA